MRSVFSPKSKQLLWRSWVAVLDVIAALSGSDVTPKSTLSGYTFAKKIIWLKNLL